MTQRIAEWLRERGLVTQGDAVSFLAGETIRGIWWAHPKGRAIFRGLGAIDDDPDVLPCKLVDGKQCFVHRRLWPALARVQRERPFWPEPSAQAKQLHAEVRRKGSVLVSSQPTLRYAQGPSKLRLELERALLVVARQEHTETGAHRVRIVPFATWLPAEVAARAREIALDEALAELAACGFAPAAPRKRRSPT